MSSEIAQFASALASASRPQQPLPFMTRCLFSDLFAFESDLLAFRRRNRSASITGAAVQDLFDEAILDYHEAITGQALPTISPEAAVESLYEILAPKSADHIVAAIKAHYLGPVSGALLATVPNHLRQICRLLERLHVPVSRRVPFLVDSVAALPQLRRLLTDSLALMASPTDVEFSRTCLQLCTRIDGQSEPSASASSAPPSAPVPSAQ